MPVETTGPIHPDKVVADAIEQVRARLPSSPPYRLWRTHELRDAVDDRRYALPLMVLTQNGLWVVHVHPSPGIIEGDDEIWQWNDKGREVIAEAPFREVQDRARVLREALQRDGLSNIEVRSLVLLARATMRQNPSKPKRHDLVELSTITDRLLEAPTGHAVGSRDVEVVAAALQGAGVREAISRQMVGEYRLGALLAEHTIWQEHDAARRDDESKHARIRTWVLPRAERPDRRASLQRAAVREAAVLSRIGQHPNILSLLGTVDQGELPRLVFEPFEGALPLHQLMRVRELTLAQKLSLLEQVADALDHCHRHEVTHRNLSPDAVLVRLREDRVEARIHRFESAVARQAEASALGTRHLSTFTERIDELYRAPEVFRDPDAADASSDLFSLGALAWFLFTGRHPGPTLVERAKQLIEDEGLRLWRVRDDFDNEFIEAIASATRESIPEREEAVRRWARGVFGSDREPTIRTWINGVLSLHREDEPDALPVDPQLAEPGQSLGQGLTVHSVLGSGSSARVLAVVEDEQLFALKVPHNANHEPQLRAEAAVLRRITHDGVVKLVDEITLSGRLCLLMQFAGEETLADLVRKQGTLALDYVHRLGDELLDVLVHLHELGITHRDLKPTNLAFNSAGNQARRLLLFDFSLAALSPDRIGAGTHGWRDPTIERRGLWDAQADLYAAAAVLHYALTGQRPAWSDREQSIRIVETRFDPALRGALAGFFARAFATEIDERYLDASDMRHAWNELFARDVTSITPEHDGPIDQRLARARLETPIGALGLSARALNALERTGVIDVRDLLDLPRNRLSLVRGVGRETRDEIGRAVTVLADRLGGRADAVSPAFLPGVSLLPIALAEMGLPLSQAALDALHDAAIRSSRDLAEASADRVARLLRPHDVDLDALRSALGAEELPVEGVIGDWVNTLLRPNPPSRRTKWELRAGMLFGLDPMTPDDAPPGGRTNAAVARALGETLVQLRSSFQKARSHWDRDPALRDRVIAAIGEALDRLGPVAPIPEVADALLQAHAPAQREEVRAQTQAVALVRFGAEVSLPSAPFVWRRIGGHAWLARSGADLDALSALALAADQLAEEERVLAPEEAQRALFLDLPASLSVFELQVLIQRVVAASSRMALSPRLELYPRGLSARRAVEMAAAVLAPGLEPEAVRKRVAARYPEAQPLPDRPELDALLEGVGLRWSSEPRAYVRPDALGPTAALSSTDAWHTSMLTTALPNLPLPALSRADRFEVTLQRSLESGRFRVFQVSARRAEEAQRALAERVPTLLVTSLDQAIWEGLSARIASAGADPGFVLGVDREGPTGQHWELFVGRFVTPVVDAVVDGVLAERSRPRLLVNPGLLARYGQGGALDRLVRRTEEEEGQGIWLLLPSWDDGGMPVVRHPYGDVPVPVYVGGQRVRVPRGWLVGGGDGC